MIGRITRTWDEDGMPMALVKGDDGEQRACLLYVPEATAGSQVLVHAGFAVELLDPDETEEAPT
jgi:hydrogenase expression/formation protein HypC